MDNSGCRLVCIRLRDIEQPTRECHKDDLFLIPLLPAHKPSFPAVARAPGAMTMKINYARETGIYSVSAAIVFAALYAPFLVRFAYMSYRQPVHVHFAVALFCIFSIIGFSIRAAMAASEELGSRLSLLITQEIMFTVGYLILLYSSHSLVMNLTHICLPEDLRKLNRRALRLTRSHHLFHFLLSAAIILALSAAITNNGTGRERVSDILDVVSSTLFMVLTVLQAVHSGLFARLALKKEHRERHRAQNHSFGERNAVFLLLLISFLYLISETFSMVTVQNDEQANNERLLYPLGFLPELLAVGVFAIPGLVPSTCVRKFPWSRQRVLQVQYY
ncbi:hypothetical protein JR316_0006537 [Psilocybe cubensis]|uniref:Uncharacterized protein n=2 Tax=Psilocybe cubensis TaxID=181762 RepID=A0ACB8H2Y1_PSICU|nr:hypothetical protein JR316_0006537 [Psilocybe cubensis]KAH9482007.1 hypothetical protein JR316_0006537 [Psilocybe cubensis]